jgi:hypothetical protein
MYTFLFNKFDVLMLEDNQIKTEWWVTSKINEM